MQTAARQTQAEKAWNHQNHQPEDEEREALRLCEKEAGRRVLRERYERDASGPWSFIRSRISERMVLQALQGQHEKT
jgi:hypothetical protein